MSEFLRCVIRAYDGATHRADVQPVASLATRITGLPVATNIPAAAVVAGRECAVLLFTEDNPADGVVISVHGTAALGGAAPTDARYFTLGLNSVLTNEVSVDEADETTLPAGKDLHYKWLDDGGERLFRIGNEYAGTGVLRVLFEAGDTVTFELFTSGQAHPKLQFDDQGFGYGSGAAPADTRIQRVAAGQLGVNTGVLRLSKLFVLPSPQAITAATNTIASNGYMRLTANASYTMTSTPTIANGLDGEIVILVNADTVDTITLQDQGTLAGSNLRLGAATRALGPRDSIILIYDAVVGDWVELAYSNVI